MGNRSILLQWIRNVGQRVGIGPCWLFAFGVLCGLVGVIPVLELVVVISILGRSLQGFWCHLLDEARWKTCLVRSYLQWPLWKNSRISCLVLFCGRTLLLLVMMKLSSDEIVRLFHTDEWFYRMLLWEVTNLIPLLDCFFQFHVFCFCGHYGFYCQGILILVKLWLCLLVG